MDVDFTFPHSYEVEEIRDYPGDGKFRVPVFSFPAQASSRGSASWLKFIPQSGEPWVGAFAHRYDSPPAISRIVSTPDPAEVCVVSAGGGYVVKVNDPSAGIELPIMPILDARPITSHDLLLLSEFTRILAYGRKGIAWFSPRLCWDELKMGEVAGDSLTGTGYDPTGYSSGATKMPFEVDLKTGRSLLPGPVSVDGQPVW